MTPEPQDQPPAAEPAPDPVLEAIESLAARVASVEESLAEVRSQALARVPDPESAEGVAGRLDALVAKLERALNTNLSD